PAGLSVRTEWSVDVRSPERVYGPVYLSVKTVQATGEESHIYMFVHPADLTHYHWSIQKERDRQLVFPRHLDLDTIPKNSES
ncbi:unnamed protein product, partial [Callosobruchus maculatus]